MKKLLLVLLLGLFLSACASETIMVVTATPEIVPTATVTAPIVPTADLIGADELGFHVGDILRASPGIWPLDDVPQTGAMYAYQLLDIDAEFRGWVIVWMFDNSEQAQLPWSRLSNNLLDRPEESQLNDGRVVAKDGIDFDPPLFTDVAELRDTTMVLLSIKFTNETTAILYFDGLLSRLDL